MFAASGAATQAAAAPEQQMSASVGAAAKLQSVTDSFSTTTGFTTTHGFVITSAVPPPAVRSSHSGGSSSRASSGHSRSTSSSAADASGAAAGGANADHRGGGGGTPVGWSGLLEISRSTGCPGVVGSVASMDWLELEGPGHIEVSCTAHTTPGVRQLVKSVIRGLKARQEPEAAREGMGGTYFFPNEAGRKVGIFKPCDEEPLAPANPKGYVGRALGDPGWKSTVRVGEAAMREVAAYLLDHGHSAGVPHTVLVRAAHPLFNYTYHGGAAPAPAAEPGVPAGPARPLKLGSLQEFVHHLADTNEMGSGRFCTRDVHAIGILDLRLFNTDRHAGNILVRAPASATPASGGSSTAVVVPGMAAAAAVSRGGYRLVPIDHGFCLPEALEAPYFEWLHWPQACLPFDAHELDYIERLDARADVALLQRELPNLRPECLRVLEVSTTLLQRCAAAGLSLADIGALASRPLDALDGDDSRPSELERACVAARQAVETRELAAMLSSSCSSSDGVFAFREEDEEGLVDTTDLEDGEEEEHEGTAAAPESAEVTTADATTATATQQQQQQQQAHAAQAASVAGTGGIVSPHPPSGSAAPRGGVRPQSRLAVAAAAADADMAWDAEAADGCDHQQLPAGSSPGSAAGGELQTVCVGGSGSIDLGSVASEGTTTGCGLSTAMSLGSTQDRQGGRGGGGGGGGGGGVDADLLFDLEDEPQTGATACNSGGSGSSSTPLAAADSDAERALELAAYLGETALLLPPGAGGARRALGVVLPAGSTGASLGSPGVPPVTPGGIHSSGSGELASPGPPMPPLARSVHMGDTWLVRCGGLQSKAAGAAAKGPRCSAFGGGASGAASRKAGGPAAAAAAARRRTTVSRAMYPPPVVRAAPRATNEVLSGLGEEQWDAFMRELHAYMDAALRAGTGSWRRASEAAGLGGAAMSCPRF